MTRTRNGMYKYPSAILNLHIDIILVGRVTELRSALVQQNTCPISDHNGHTMKHEDECHHP